MKYLRSLFIIFLILLFGCGKGKTSPENTIVFLNNFTSQKQKDVLNKLIKTFEKQFDCKVLVQDNDLKEVNDNIINNNYKTGIPDVVELNSTNILFYASSGFLQDLQFDSIVLKKFKADILINGKINNKLYVLPWYCVPRVLYYNKTLLKKAGIGEKPPNTMSELLNFAIQINSLDNYYGFGAVSDDPLNLIPELMIFFRTFNSKMNDSVFSLNYKEYSAGFYFYLNLTRAGIMETQRQINSYFIQGKLGFCIADDNLTEKIRLENPALNYGITLIPGNNKERGTSFTDVSFLGISSKCSNKKLAQDFIIYLTQANTAKEICDAISEGHLPANHDIVIDKDFFSKGNRQIWYNQLYNSKPLQANSNWFKYYPSISKSFLDVIYGITSPESALNNTAELLSESRH